MPMNVAHEKVLPQSVQYNVGMLACILGCDFSDEKTALEFITRWHIYDKMAGFGETLILHGMMENYGIPDGSFCPRNYEELQKLTGSFLHVNVSRTTRTVFMKHMVNLMMRDIKSTMVVKRD